MIAAPPPSGPTTIISHVSVPVHGKITGTFTATGAIADDGTLVDT